MRQRIETYPRSSMSEQQQRCESKEENFDQFRRFRSGHLRFRSSLPRRNLRRLVSFELEINNEDLPLPTDAPPPIPSRSPPLPLTPLGSPYERPPLFSPLERRVVASTSLLLRVPLLSSLTLKLLQDCCWLSFPRRLRLRDGVVRFSVGLGRR